MRRLALVALLACAPACNAVLDIPDRPLAADDDATTVDSDADGSVIDSGHDGAIPDTSDPDSSDPDSSDPDTSDPDATPDSIADASDAADDADTAVADSGTVDSSDDTAIDAGDAGDAGDGGDGGDGAVDSAAPDTGTDTGTPDTGADTGAPDTRAPDTGTPDPGPSCGVTGTPCCGAVPASCGTGSACAADAEPPTCEPAAGACTRASDCTGTCTGPEICDGKVCFKCAPASLGTTPIGGACETAGQCTTSVCDRSRKTCTVTCSPGMTGDADCAALGAKGVCSASNVTVTSGPESATGWIGLCAYSCVRDGDCKAGERCRFARNDVADRFDLTCVPPPVGATTDYGDACDAATCMGGLCLGSGSSYRCVQLCSTNADCTGPDKTCAFRDLGRPVSGAPQAIKMCVP